MYEEQKVERKKRIYLSGTDLRDRDHGHFNGCGSTFLQLYLYDEKEAGRLTVGKLHKLMNLNLSDPENVLADYISGGQKNSRIVSVDADLKTGQLKKLIYENKFVKVSLTVDEDGTRNMEEDTMDKAD